MKQDNLVLDGVVIQELGNAMFKVKMDNGHELTCTISGKMRTRFIRVLVGDKVTLEVSPYDLTRGRIIRREKPTTTTENKSNNNKKK